jgi:HAD superfamily hydrolase (TIGR01490 family)
VPAAAFFDLDRTLISHSSSLALAGTFHRRGLLRRRQVLKAALAQFLFVRFGAGPSRVGQTAEKAMAILRGLPAETMDEIVAQALDPVLKPLLYREAVDLAASHAARGEKTFIVSGALQEVVDGVARSLGFHGAVGSRAEIADGVYTGRLERRLFGQAKADILDEIAAAEDLDLEASTAYSDSYTDLAFLERVGNPVAVNPDRELRKVAAARGWPVRRFRTKAFPTP